MPEILNKSVAEGGSSENADKIRLKIPLKGETDWALLLRKCFEEIAEHKHEGSGDGQQIETNGIKNNNITYAKIQDLAANSVLLRDANSIGDVSAKEVGDAKLLIGNGAGFTAATLTQDVTMTNAGLVTISNNAINNAKMDNDSVNTDEIVNLAVTNAKLAADSVTQAKIANDNITVDKKQTTEITGMSDPQVLNTGLASDKSFIIHYRIKDGSDFQIGTLSGVSNSCLVDEFVGADLEASFDFNGNDIEINGASGKDLQYSIEFLE